MRLGLLFEFVVGYYVMGDLLDYGFEFVALLLWDYARC